MAPSNSPPAESATSPLKSVADFVRSALRSRGKEDEPDEAVVESISAALYDTDVKVHFRRAGAFGSLVRNDPSFSARVCRGELGPEAVAALCEKATPGLLRGQVRRVFTQVLKDAPGVAAGGDGSGLEVILEEVVFRRFGTTPADYYRAARLVAGVVAKPQGTCLETCLAADVASGALGIDEFLDAAWNRGDRYRKAVAPPDERTTVRALFYGLLDGFGEARTLFASELERGCFNEVIKECEAEAIKCQWDVPKFRNLYSARCGRLAAHLDRGGSIARSVGGAPVYNQLKSGAWRPDVVGTLENDDLCAAAHRKVKDTINKRLQQKVVKRRSAAFPCPKCHARDCEWGLVQTRALDEPATIFCTCVCGHRFTG